MIMLAAATLALVVIITVVFDDLEARVADMAIYALALGAASA